MGGKGFFYSGSLPLRSRRCFKGDDCFNMLIFHRPACGDDRLKSPLMINVQIPLKMCKNNVRSFLLLLFLDHLNNVERRYRIEALVREFPGTTPGAGDTCSGLSS